MNTFRSFILAAGALVAVSAPALAYDRSFAITNTDNWASVWSVYATDVDTGRWGADLLGDYTIDPGDTEWVEPMQSQLNRGYCMFDVKIVFDDGSKVIIPNADLCQLYEIRTNGSSYRLEY